MWKKLALFAVPAQVAALTLMLSGTGSAQVVDPGIIDVPGVDSAPESLTLSGTIRDFMASHPDFEEAYPNVSGADQGIVEPTIGADRKPVYASPTTTPMTSGEGNFDQWYRDVAGVNRRTEHAITFDRIPDSDPPRYRYTGTDFFPIDGRLWGNEGQPHNYWFTYELHNSFTYQGGEVFSFTGDDDVWVFINDRLVIDLGGVHPAMSASVDLDEVAGQLGLTEGETYSFDMFFAERHTSHSNFIAETSIILEEPPAGKPPVDEPPSDEPPDEPPPPPCKKP